MFHISFYLYFIMRAQIYAFYSTYCNFSAKKTITVQNAAMVTYGLIS